MPTKEGKANPWNHPFWSVTQSAWIETKDLKEGEILSLGDGSEISIESITHYDTEETTVYNFEVEGNHTYYVSEAGVLVHNQSKAYALAPLVGVGAASGPVGWAFLGGLTAVAVADVYCENNAKCNSSRNEFNDNTAELFGSSIDNGDIARDTSLSPKEAKNMKDLGLDPFNSSDVAAFREKTPTEKGKETYEKGKIGEDKVKKRYDIGDKQEFEIDGRRRIPDGVNRSAISEVKNVKYQGWTQQLQDYSDIAKRENLRFDLYLQKDAKISRNLVKAWREGKVNIIDFD